MLGNASGFRNTAVGAFALTNNIVGEQNTAVGIAALQNNTDSFNTAVGVGAIGANTVGFRNTAVCAYALGKNQEGIDNIAIGLNAGSQFVAAETGNIDIGNDGVGGENSTTRIGTLQSSTFIAGIHNAAVTGTAVVVSTAGQLGVAPSSQRFKTAIKPMEQASKSVLSLKPVVFRYNKEIDPAGTLQFGLVAEEVAQVNPDLVVRDQDGKPYTVRYEAVNAMLLNEFLKEHRKVQALEATVTQQQKGFQSKLAAQEKRIEALASGLQKVSAQIETTKPAPQVAVNNQ